jgi:hypothetical protein
MLCTLNSNAKIYFVHVPWGASSFYLKHQFVLIILFISHGILIGLNNIVGMRMPYACACCIQMQIIICAQALGSLLILFRAFFLGLIIISISFGIFFCPNWYFVSINLFFGSSDCLPLLLMLFHLIIFVCNL